MRLHAIVAVASLIVLPQALAAQRVAPVPGIRRGTPNPPSRQPEPIARAMAYQRSRWAFETYPIASYVSAPGIAGGGSIPHWASLGTGTRAEYRSTSSLTTTVDMTTSLLGGPAFTETMEVGARYRPSTWESALRPYVDVRAAFQRSGGNYSLPIDGSTPFGSPPLGATGMQYSRGFGGVAGAGVEYCIARSFALTTGMSVLRSQMSTYHFTGTSFPSDGNFMMTTYRLTLGLRFNSVRAIQTP